VEVCIAAFPSFWVGVAVTVRVFLVHVDVVHVEVESSPLSVLPPLLLPPPPPPAAPPKVKDWLASAASQFAMSMALPFTTRQDPS
jgi:ABC-type dipeptide/oligopeptide/nickel transport system permease component